MSSFDTVIKKLDMIQVQLDNLLDSIRISGTQVVVQEGLSDISTRLGLIQAGEFRTGNGKNPGNGFSGVRIGFPAFTYNSTDWHIAGVNNDTLQVGIRASDGTLLAGAGDVVLSSSGIVIEAGLGPTNRITWHDSVAGNDVGDIWAADTTRYVILDVYGGVATGGLQLYTEYSGGEYIQLEQTPQWVEYSDEDHVWLYFERDYTVDNSPFTFGFNTGLANKANFHIGESYYSNYSAPSNLPHADADTLVLENPLGNVGMTIYTPATYDASIFFADSDDNDVGKIVYDHGANSLGITVNGNATQAIFITSANLVGLGTASPSAKLHIFSGSSGSTVLGGSADELLVENSANAGITIRTPDANAGYIMFTDTVANSGYIYYDHSANAMGFATAGTAVLSFLSNQVSYFQGNVGLGTATPDGILHIFEGSAGSVAANALANDLVIESDDSSFGMSFLGSATSTQYILFGDVNNNAVGKILYSHVADEIHFKVAGNSSAALELGNTLASFIGSVYIPNASWLYFRTTGSAVGFYMTAGDQFVWNEGGVDVDFRFEGDADTNLLYLDAGNSYIGIGTNSPNDKLEVNGRIREQGTFADIHMHDGSTAQSIATGTTYTKLTGFVDNGESANCTPDVANDKITITKPGRYFVSTSISGSSGTANVTFRFAVFLNGVEQDSIEMARKFGTAGDVGAGSCSGIMDVTSVPVDVDVRARHDNGSNVNFTPFYMNFAVMYLGET